MKLKIPTRAHSQIKSSQYVAGSNKYLGNRKDKKEKDGWYSPGSSLLSVIN